MSKRALCLVVLALFGAFACQPAADVPQEPVDLAAEEEAIKAVIQQQIEAWSNRNLDGEAAVWAHEPYIFRGYPTDNVVGWESLRGLYQEAFEEGSWPPRSAEMSNYHIHIAGENAWAVYRQVTESTNEQGETQSAASWELRILEKKADQWKLVLQMTGPEPD
jgi:ketosteroid isomerase-like protein